MGTCFGNGKEGMTREESANEFHKNSDIQQCGEKVMFDCGQNKPSNIGNHEKVAKQNRAR